MKLKNNNAGDRITPIALFFVLFPIVATIWEVANILINIVHETQTNGWIVHIPVWELFRLLLVGVITRTQYKLATKISQWKGWQQPKVCSSIEAILLLSIAFTS